MLLNGTMHNKGKGTSEAFGRLPLSMWSLQIQKHNGLFNEFKLVLETEKIVFECCLESGVTLFFISLSLT